MEESTQLEVGLNDFVGEDVDESVGLGTGALVGLSGQPPHETGQAARISPSSSLGLLHRTWLYRGLLAHSQFRFVLSLK